jgi:hypothetical protein
MGRRTLPTARRALRISVRPIQRLVVLSVAPSDSSNGSSDSPQLHRTHPTARRTLRSSVGLFQRLVVLSASPSYSSNGPSYSPQLRRTLPTARRTLRISVGLFQRLVVLSAAPSGRSNGPSHSPHLRRTLPTARRTLRSSVGDPTDRHRPLRHPGRCAGGLAQCHGDSTPAVPAISRSFRPAELCLWSQPLPPRSKTQPFSSSIW